MLATKIDLILYENYYLNNIKLYYINNFISLKKNISLFNDSILFVNSDNIFASSLKSKNILHQQYRFNIIH